MLKPDINTNPQRGYGYYYYAWTMSSVARTCESDTVHCHSILVSIRKQTVSKLAIDNNALTKDPKIVSNGTAKFWRQIFEMVQTQNFSK